MHVLCLVLCTAWLFASVGPYLQHHHAHDSIQQTLLRVEFTPEWLRQKVPVRSWPRLPFPRHSGASVCCALNARRMCRDTWPAKALAPPADSAPIRGATMRRAHDTRS
eukprot:356704-Chlamydomonas_euryale.AAC.19